MITTNRAPGRAAALAEEMEERLARELARRCRGGELELHLAAQAATPSASTAEPAPAASTVAPAASTATSTATTSTFETREPWVPTEPRMPERPTLIDFFRYDRFPIQSVHCMQSAQRARTNGSDEETVFACLIHDLVQTIIKADHGWWSAQLFEPYVSERVAWSLRYHQALRFFADPAVGYEVPALYADLFGADYVPEPYLQEAYRYARDHLWYGYSRAITVNDDYSFQEGVTHDIEEFADVVGRHFKQPKEGLGFDGSSVAHMWRTLINPTRPL
jgi:hypothetical protein